MPTEAVSVVDPSGEGDYLTLQAWANATAGLDLPDLGLIHVAEMVDGVHDLDAVSIATCKVDADHYRVVRPQGAAYNHQTGTGPILRGVNTNYPVTHYASGFRFEGLGIKWEVGTPLASRMWMIARADLTNVLGLYPLRFDRCTFWAEFSAGASEGAYRHLDPNYPVEFRSCDFIGNSNAALGYSNLVNFDAGVSDGCKMLNCSVHGAQARGIRVKGDEAITFENTVATGTVVLGDFQFDSTTANVVMNNCASEDATASGLLGSGNLTGVDLATAYEDAAAGDLRLALGSALIDAGKDLSSDFTLDRLGKRHGRNGTWDIGAYDFRGYPENRIVERTDFLNAETDTARLADREVHDVDFASRQPDQCRIL
jgi:hypothetical protein